MITSFLSKNIKARNHFKVSFSQKKIRVTNNRITRRKSQNLLIMLHAYVVRRFLSKRKRKESQKRSMVYFSTLLDDLPVFMEL